MKLEDFAPLQPVNNEDYVVIAVGISGSPRNCGEYIRSGQSKSKKNEVSTPHFEMDNKRIPFSENACKEQPHGMKCHVFTGNTKMDALLEEYHVYFDTETEEIHLECFCDSTAAFLREMVRILEMLKCEDIKTDGSIREDIPGPYNYRYHAFGKFKGTGKIE